MTRHIVIITTSFPIDCDGSEAAGAFAHDFVESLSRGTKVSVIAPGFRSEQETNNGISVYRYWTPRNKPLSTLNPLNPFQLMQILMVLVSGFRATSMLNKTTDSIDFVFCLWVFPSGLWGRWLAKSRNVQYGTWALGSDIWSLSKIPVLGQVIKRILTKSSSNFADGFSLASDVQTISGKHCDFLPSSRHIPIIEKKPNTQGPFKLGFLGRWHENKGIDILIDALSLLEDDDWSRINKVTLAGGGPLQDLVSSSVQELSSKGRAVELRGFLDQQQAADFISEHDYILLPSRKDSIPVILSDAIRNYSPLISTPVGDMPELITKYNCGILSFGFSAVEFSEAIKMALSTAPGQFLKKREILISDFSVDHSAAKLLENAG